MNEIFENLYEMTAFSNIIAEPQFLIMYAIAFVLLYLGIKKQYEPLLLVPIAFGVLLANFPGGDMGVIQADENGMVMINGVMKNIWEMPLHDIAHELGLMNFIYYMLIKTGFLPPIIFMGVGALTDFGPMLRNLRLSIFGAAAQLGIFTVLLVSILMGFTPKEAASLGIIGGADGPTAIFTTIKLAPHLLGPIAIAAYSYMALVPVIIPLVVKLLCSKKELSINMKEQEKKYPSKTEIKNLRVLKIIFPIVVTTVVALFVPSAVPLIGMLMFGNLVKEIGSNTFRLFDAASNSIMNAATIFLGLSVGATMTTEAFLNWTTIGIVIGGFLAFALSITGGILFVKLVNLFSKKKINPLIGATGLSAVPMASRAANEDLFIMSISMQNHGGYTEKYDNFDEKVRLLGLNYPDVNQYLSLVHESDSALEYLISYFQNVDDPVEIVFFGDHQPSLSSSFYPNLNGKGLSGLTEDELEDLYTIPFFIWTNYESTEVELPVTSINYLSTLALERAGIELPAYNQFLADMMETIPAINSRGYYSKSAGGFLHIEEATGEEADWIRNYNILQYNNMFDKKEKSEVFFPYLK